MVKERLNFCEECRQENRYEIKMKKYMHTIKGKQYCFDITSAVCEKCGSKINIPGILDINAKEIDAQYRLVENIVSVDDIQSLMELYNIGKAPLSIALGFGEITITRYLQGQIPSEEYSNIIRNALENPDYMIECLNNNREKIGEAAFKKSIKSAEDIKKMFIVSKKMLLTISYIFKRVEEVTPLALQKLLYYIQGIYMVKYGEVLYPEECQAWVHGPVYEPVYNMFKSFKYNPIEDSRFYVLKNIFKELTKEEKEVIDLVLDSFGMYSGKILEKITHCEEPWLNARKNCFPYEASNEIISNEAIKEYFLMLSKEYDLNSLDGLNDYINHRLQSI